MDVLSKDDLLELMNECGGVRVSIYMPTHRLKNLLDKAEDQLTADGLRAPEAQEMLEPARALLADGYFWQHQSDGLALFISPDTLRYYRAPLVFGSLVTVGDRLHLKWLLSLLTGDGRFYVLALSQGEVRLLHGTRYSVSAVNLESVPSSLAEALKWDDLERQTQLHTSTATPRGESALSAARGGRPAIFHGHGVDSAEEHKEHILRYFRQVNAGLHEILAGERAPLILAAVDYLRSIYAQANTYTHLLEAGIPGNPEGLSDKALHDRAWAIVEPVFAQERERAIERYRQLAGAESEKASNDLSHVVLAAYFGRVETLFVALGVQVWGVFDPDARKVQVHAEPMPGDEDLLDLAAVHTLLHGGIAYAVEPAQVPNGSVLAAVFRY